MSLPEQIKNLTCELEKNSRTLTEEGFNVRLQAEHLVLDKPNWRFYLSYEEVEEFYKYLTNLKQEDVI